MCITTLICKRKILPVGEEDAKHIRRYSHIIRSPTSQCLKWSTARISLVHVKLVLQTNRHRMHGTYYVKIYRGVYKNIVTSVYMRHMEGRGYTLVST